MQRKQIPFSEIKRGGCYTLVEIDRKKNYLIGLVIQTFTEHQYGYTEGDTDLCGEIMHFRDECAESEDFITKDHISNSERGCSVNGSKFMVFESTEWEIKALRKCMDDYSEFRMPRFRRQFLDHYVEGDFNIKRKRLSFEELQIGKVYTLMNDEGREDWPRTGKYKIDAIFKPENSTKGFLQGHGVYVRGYYEAEDTFSNGDISIDPDEEGYEFWAFEANQEEIDYLEACIKAGKHLKGFDFAFEDDCSISAQVIPSYEIF